MGYENDTSQKARPPTQQGEPMNIAIVGGGISGVTAAWYLSKQHNVTLFEANDYIGGHTDTHQIHIEGTSWSVDTGFIVFNEYNYPNFSQLLSELKVRAIDTEMSFSVDNADTGLQYNATSLNTLFCQRKNLINPAFYRMIADIIKFYKASPDILKQPSNTQTVGEYLKKHGYSDVFIHDHLIPMACALWSGPSVSLLDMPVRYLVSFMANHKMLSLMKRPQWRVVEGGSNQYIKQFIHHFSGKIHQNSPVENIQRTDDGVILSVNGEKQMFDAVVLACHSDQALSLLADSSYDEATVLGNIDYQRNHMQLHTDESVLPSNRAAWASWNVHVSPDLQEQCTVSYHMNTLQRLDAPVEFIVSLNSAARISPDKVLVERHYSHPVYTEKTLAAQQRWADISGQRHTYFCGAYWDWGFHEDGVKSALKVVQQLNGEVL
jgi:hypothetical protein